MMEQTAAANDVANIATNVGGVAGGLLALGWLGRVFFRKWMEEGTATVRTEAERDIIDQLRGEVGRLSEQLAVRDAALVDLRGEVEAMRTENAELRADVRRLTLALDERKI